ncbi:MAG: hypothetical protein FWE53_05100 [Firmicutes bacterium]|nr:hypothetical protein [Bacillota bacterium]
MDKNLKEIFDAYKHNNNASKLLAKFAETVVPNNNEKDPTWAYGAQNFLQAAMLSLLQNPKVTEDTFTLDAIKKAVELGVIDDPADLKNTKQVRLLKYFKNQSLECRQLADGVISNAPSTFLNYLSLLYIYLVKIN